ncbi:hypothetical protein OC842_006851 [Tilletia horrida]|uniref:Uncharacterized protein n=1 Tax=Tilletia horrida TaxID=155126 RepID=A0AAN6JH84_9BASI|nr:hypothetical protein OC842_006851 [Tilletia horrida]
MQVVAYLALALSALLPLTVLAAAEQGSDIDADSYLRALNALGAVKIHADPSTIELHEDKRDGTPPLTRRGLDEVNRKDKHLVDKEKLELMKKIHDKEIKAAEVTFSEKITFFYLDEHDGVLKKGKDKKKALKVHKGGRGDGF